MKKIFLSKYYLGGIIFGFLACCILGYVISKESRYNHFIRFHSYISPTLDYYPTANELLATAKHKVANDKIVIVIGGNSLFRGGGQNSDELWSERLQKNLGNDYKVLNYAFNGAGFASFGAVGFRILSEYYSKILFVSTCSISDEQLDGNAYYKYLFWDAYYKKLFHPSKDQQKHIKKLQKKELQTASGLELHLMNYLDSVFYFKNLWNWVSYRFVFTVWNKNALPKPFKPKRLFVEDKYDNKLLAETVGKERFANEVNDIAQSNLPKKYINGDFSALKDSVSNELNALYKQIFIPSERKKVICFLPTYNPQHLAALPAKDRDAYELIIENSKSLLTALGYNAVRSNELSPNDYLDIMHYLSTGGFKVADQLTTEIQRVAKLNNYVA